MKLDIIHPTFEIIQKSTGKKLIARRFLVKEEKILLFAKQSKDINEIFRSIKDIIKVCIQDKNFDVESIPMFDLEYIFIQLRSKSVNSIEKIDITDDQDKSKYTLTINFDDVDVVFPENPPSKNIKVNDNITIVMRYPLASIYDDKDFSKRIKVEGLFELIVKCVENVYNKDELVEMTIDEKKEFLDNLDVKTYKKIEEFLYSTPSLKYTVEYVNKLGVTRTLTFNSLMDFFLYV